MSLPSADAKLSLGRAAAPHRDQREHRRFRGPFYGRRVGAIETPIRLHDLSRGGCCITSMHAQTHSIRLTLRLRDFQSGHGA